MLRTDRWRHWLTDVKKEYPPSSTCTVCGGYNEKKIISFCFQKSFSKTQINMKRQKPTFPILTPIRLKLLLLLKERKKEKKERSRENNPCFLEDFKLWWNRYCLSCLHVDTRTGTLQLNFIIHFKHHWCLLPGTCQT